MVLRAPQRSVRGKLGEHVVSIPHGAFALSDPLGDDLGALSDLKQPGSIERAIAFSCQPPVIAVRIR